jgi:hypothetical protein
MSGRRGLRIAVGRISALMRVCSRGWWSGIRGRLREGAVGAVGGGQWEQPVREPSIISSIILRKRILRILEMRT